MVPGSNKLLTNDIQKWNCVLDIMLEKLALDTNILILIYTKNIESFNI